MYSYRTHFKLNFSMCWSYTLKLIKIKKKNINSQNESAERKIDQFCYRHPRWHPKTKYQWTWNRWSRTLWQLTWNNHPTLSKTSHSQILHFGTTLDRTQTHHCKISILWARSAGEKPLFLTFFGFGVGGSAIFVYFIVIGIVHVRTVSVEKCSNQAHSFRTRHT